MKAVTLSASFDGEHIRLEEDFPLRKNARLLVTVLPDDSETERADWLRLSAQGLTRAYSQKEPEYTMDMVREPNPDYDGR